MNVFVLAYLLAANYLLTPMPFIIKRFLHVIKWNNHASNCQQHRFRTLAKFAWCCRNSKKRYLANAFAEKRQRTSCRARSFNRYARDFKFNPRRQNLPYSFSDADGQTARNGDAQRRADGFVRKGSSNSEMLIWRRSRKSALKRCWQKPLFNFLCNNFRRAPMMFARVVVRSGSLMIMQNLEIAEESAQFAFF